MKVSALIVVFGVADHRGKQHVLEDYHVYQAEIFPSDIRQPLWAGTGPVSPSSAALPFILIPVLNHFGATAMFAVVVAALAATVIVLAPIGPRTTGKSLDEVNPI